MSLPSEQHALFEAEDTLIEEVMAWNTLSPSTNGSAMTTSNTKQIVAAAFTYSNINTSKLLHNTRFIFGNNFNNTRDLIRSGPKRAF